MAKLKPWYQVVTPREDLRENRPLDASEFAVHLDHVRDGRAHADYVKPERFFERTFVTDSLLDLTCQVLRRLSGIQVETSAVFNMATQFGGGKTHSLTALYHLAKHGESSKGWKGVDAILAKSGLAQVPKADVAVFVGTEFDVLTGRGGGNEPVRKTPWGEIAWQLGRERAFAAIAEHDAKGIAPAGDVIREMLPTGPTLILMDELLHYMSVGRKLGLGDQLYNFVRSLGEEIRGRDYAVLCVSVPSSSDVEMGSDDRRDYEALKQQLDRLGKAIIMSADKEMSEIIRRRLFEWEGLNNDAKATISAYAEWAADHAQELAGIDRDAVHEQFRACYPFHPSVISVFERKWQSLPRFQRTRGILRLLALWVAHNFQEEHRNNSKEPLLTLGLAPLDNPVFRAALFEQLGSSELEIPVTADITGKTSESHSVRLDKEASEAIRKSQLHRKVATTVFFESNGGQSQARAEASLPEIKTDVCGPDVNTTDVDTVLEALSSTCFYLQWERNRYRFGLTPNLNQVLVSRRGAVQEKAINDRIRQRTEELFRKNSSDRCKFIEREFFPMRSNEVKEIPRLTLVVMAIDQAAEARATVDLMAVIIRDSGTTGRTLKSALIFAVVDPSHNVRDKAREALAWEDIDDDEETKKRIDEGQLNLLKKNLKTAQRDLDEAIFRAYNHLYLLDKENKLRHIPLGSITSSSAESIVEEYLQRLGSNGGLDEVVDSIPARKLTNYWPASLNEWSTKAVRDAFYSTPILPRPINPDSIKRAIADGVTQGFIGYATKDNAGRLHLERLKESLFDVDVEISEDVYILKAEDAQRLREPPHLATLAIRPEQPVLRVGDQASFTCAGIDQYGQPFPVAAVTWSATGGSIDKSGMFTAGTTSGLYNVKAESSGCEAYVELRLIAKEETAPGPTIPGKQMIRWRGAVPTQKWMNFYTKVLTRFASEPDFKLEVSFQVPVDRELAKTREAETRSGLKELGLDDNVTGT